MYEGLSGQELHDKVLEAQVGWFNACRETIDRAKRGQFSGPNGVSAYQLAYALRRMANFDFAHGAVFNRGVRALLKTRDLAWQKGNSGEIMGICFAWPVLSATQKGLAGKLLVELGWYGSLPSDERQALLCTHPELMQCCEACVDWLLA